ncbi:ABC transporter permease [Skermania sp. ID1734]|uniref:ABC transporter permease n=1 Tax=Skermania sp. ID1734 TaxID=2597516 RepID=UPI00117CA07B|nr:ABC transporter permease [Skermania sp. ID1734]TSE01879.1 ABC transporter permease [Skermania sp. ID1734]
MTTLVTAAARTEFRKVITVRLWWLTPIVALLVGAAASLVYGFTDRNADNGSGTAVPLGAASLGLYVAVGAVVVLGGLFGAATTGSDVRYRTLASSFVLQPRRDIVLGAKLGVLAALSLIAGVIVEIVSLVCLFAFGAHVTAWSRLIGVVLCGLFAVICWTLIGAALGLLFGSATVAAFALVAWYAIGEPALALLASAMGARQVAYWLPGLSTVAAVGAGGLDDVDGFLPWAGGAVVLAVWTAAVVGAGWWLTRQRDI